MPEIHKTWGGSTADRTIYCPAWVSASEGIPAPPASPYAERGTNLHEIQEQLLTDDMIPSEWDFSQYGADADDYEEATVKAFDMTEDVMDQYDCEFFATELFLEGPLPETGGSMDLIAWGDEYFFMGDYKFGSVIVDANNNLQGLFYFWLLWNDKEWRAKMKNRKLVFGIMQPAQEGVSLWEFSLEDLNSFDIKFNDAYAKAQDVTPPRSAGKHCRYCRARSVCETQIAYGQRALTLNPKDKAHLLEALSMAKQVESWAKDVFAEAQRFMEMGEQLTGFKLVQKRAVRKWDDDKAVIEGLYRALNRDQYFTEKLLSPAQIEKLKKVPPAKRKLFEKHTVKKSSGVTIAPESDKRPAVSMEMPDALKALGEKK